ncbi:MAG: hypothetical protein K6F86_11435 [Lachnospiraceae bacterium]|nr:hypothetical protein [Lachnospiraceae bacterium]
MGLFDELAKGALDGVVGSQTANFISNKLAQSSNPTVQHYRNKVDEAFVQTSQKLRQNNPKFAQACDKATGVMAEFANEMTGNAFASQPSVQDQSTDPIVQPNAADPGDDSQSVDKNMWDFE